MNVNIPCMDPSWGMSGETNSNSNAKKPRSFRETTHATVARNLGGFGNLWMEGWTEAGTLEVLLLRLEVGIPLITRFWKHPNGGWEWDF